MSEKWNLIVDVSRCDNCRLCFLAVKDEYIGNRHAGYSAPQPLHGHSWLEIERKERGSYPIVDARFMPVMCNHCDEAPCIKAARHGAVRKRPDGIVIIDPEKARGQKQLVEACPYGAIHWNEEEELPQAWTFDAHLLDEGWTRTRAEQACPMNVFRTVKVDDEQMQRIREEEGLEVLKPELGTKPRIYYKNLHMMTKCLIGGTVIMRVDGVEECAAGAAVVLLRDGQEIGRSVTDTFGEFRFDGLEPNTSGYQLELEGQGGRFSTLFDLGAESRYLGVMRLEASEGRR